MSRSVPPRVGSPVVAALSVAPPVVASDAVGGTGTQATNAAAALLTVASCKNVRLEIGRLLIECWGLLKTVMPTLLVCVALITSLFCYFFGRMSLFKSLVESLHD
jgi:hypothetical protein